MAKPVCSNCLKKDTHAIPLVKHMDESHMWVCRECWRRVHMVNMPKRVSESHIPFKGLS